MKLRKTLCAVFLLLLLAISSTGAAVAGPITGERFQFSENPRWTNSGVWDLNGKQLLLVDVLQGSVLQYSSEGELIGRIASEALPNPILIQNVGSEALWIENNDGELSSLGQDLKPLPLINLLEKVKSPKGQLISVFGWVPLSRSELLLFGDLRRKEGDVGAVVQVDLKDPASYNILSEIGIKTPAHRFFLLGQPYLASVQGRPFYLITTDTPQIVRPDGSGFRIVQVTAAGQKEAYGVLQLPEKVTVDETARLFSQLEKSTSAAGLYGWHGSLYMLKRTPAGNGQTQWALLKIDPSTSKILWKRQIDTAASHLLVIPGDKYWAFIEKGPVKGPGHQEISSFLRVPAESIEAP